MDGTEMFAVKCCADAEEGYVKDLCSSYYNNGNCEDKCVNDPSMPKGYYCECTAQYHKLSADGLSCEVECPYGMNNTGGIYPYCLPTADFESHRFYSFGSSERSVFKVGSFMWRVVKNGDCTEIKYPDKFNESSTIMLQLTPSRIRVPPASGELPPVIKTPYTIWAEEVTNEQFRVCAENLDGPQDIADFTINWIAYERVQWPAQAGSLTITTPKGKSPRVHRTPIEFPYSYEDPDRESVFKGASEQMVPELLTGLHVQTTLNHRGKAPTKPARSPAMSAWVEGFDTTGCTIAAETAMILGDEDVPDVAPERASVDYLVFPEYARQNAEGLMSGTKHIKEPRKMYQGEDKDTNEQIYSDEVLDTSEEVGVTSVLYNPVGLMVETTSREGKCVEIRLQPKGRRLVEEGEKPEAPKLPLVFVSVDHRLDVRTSRHEGFTAEHDGLVAWVEDLTEESMMVCYKELPKYDGKSKHGDTIVIDWIALQ